jgi:hypothetical protein
VTGCERAALHAPYAKAEVDAQPCESGFELAPRQAQIQQRSQEHVSSDPGERLDVQQARARRRRRSASRPGLALALAIARGG